VKRVKTKRKSEVVDWGQKTSSAKGHRDIAEKASHHFKKASISLKMCLKSLAIHEKASESMKKRQFLKKSLQK
jgi:hypothetical protein